MKHVYIVNLFVIADMLTFVILLFLLDTSHGKSFARNITIHIGLITESGITGQREMEATFAFAVKKIRQLHLINDSVQFKQVLRHFVLFRRRLQNACITDVIKYSEPRGFES